MKQKLQNALDAAASLMPDALMVTGAGAISYGAGAIYVPAGWIVGGVFALVAGYLAARGAK